MRPLAPAWLVLLSACAAGSKTPPPSAPAQVVATPPGRYEVVAPPASKPGPLMEAVLRRLDEQDAFAQLDSSWTLLSKMPDWVSLESAKAGECEFATPGGDGVPAAMDAFRYTVIVGENRRPIVIRTGGFAGVHQIFEAKDPARPPEPAPSPLSR